MRRRQLEADEGAAAVEYALLLAGVFVLLIVVVYAFGGGVRGSFTDSCQRYASATSASGECQPDDGASAEVEAVEQAQEAYAEALEELEEAEEDAAAAPSVLANHSAVAQARKDVAHAQAELHAAEVSASAAENAHSNGAAKGADKK